MKKLRVGIVGYGNIGIGAELALKTEPGYGISGRIYKARSRISRT